MTQIGQRFLDHHLSFRPVDGSFMGREDCDGRLPRADRAAAGDEARAIAALQAEVSAAPEASVAERLDKRQVSGELAVAAATLAERPRFANPAWYTGEAAFAMIGPLLPQSAPVNVEALSERLAALPDFLADGQARLAEAGAAPKAWAARAKREAAVTAAFLTDQLPAIPGALPAWRPGAAGAARALGDFAASLDGLADRDPACGADYLGLMMREVHGFAFDADTAVKDARATFDRLGHELAEDAARLTPGRTWQQAIADLADDHPAAGQVLDTYRHWHDRSIAAADAARLVTPAVDYGLDYRELAAPFRDAAPELYFLFYRSPPALRPGDGSVYWVSPPGADEAAYLRGQNVAAIKTIHAVHHGSVGHHTQNANARKAPSLLGRIGGTDCAAGIAFLSAGTMVEGWACYAEDLLLETDDFYTPAEMLLLKQYERRNAASVLVDINLHRGTWSLDDAMRFYRDEAGFAPQRVASEVTRNSMFPASRLMYQTGVEAIRSLRRDWRGSTRSFHDTLLGYGHVPVAAAAAEMARVDR